MCDALTRWTYGDHPAQYADLYRPVGRPKTGIAVVIHGGFWRSAYDAESLGAPLCADLAARGHIAWNLEYRRVGDGGQWPATFDDVSAGIDLLATVDGLDLAKVVTIGHSAGGQLAVWAAARRPRAASSAPTVLITGAVSQAGVLNLTDAANRGVGGTAVPNLLGGMPSEMAHRYHQADPYQQLPVGLPVRALHARDDDTVPFEQSTSYVDAAQRLGDDAQLIEVTGGHYGLIDVGAAGWEATVAAFVELVRENPGR